MLLESSKDLLLIVIAFCALWLTIFTSWAIYYFAQILKQARDTMRDMRSAITIFEKLISSLHSKLDASSTHLAFIVQGVKEGLQFLNNQKTKRAARATTKRAKKTNDE